jgi:hypothetical protein
MSEPTLPLNPEGQYYTGSIYLTDGSGSNTGTGSIYLEDGDLLVSSGVTSLQKTFIHTTPGALTIDGTNGINAQVSGQILLQSSQAVAQSIYINSTNASGSVDISSAGTGASAIDINATAGGITIDSLTTLSATSGGQMTLASTATTAGAVTINANGNGGSLVLNSTGTGNSIDINATTDISLDSATLTSTQTSTNVDAINFTSAGGVEVNANSATNGKFIVTAAGAATDAILLNATAVDPLTSVSLQSAGTGLSAISLAASAGGVSISAGDNIAISTTGTGTSTVTIDSAGEVKIDTTDTTNGIKIATETSGVPVFIGTSGSLTTINGDLLVLGPNSTNLYTQSLLIEDNLIQLNAAIGVSGIDSGVVVRRYQTPNATGLGDVVENTNPTDTLVPQESGTFQTGSATPGTLVLALHASSTDDFYNGWWVRITSGTGSGQVRRIKDYVGSTRTATLFLTADNTTTPTQFSDGLDLVTAPASGDSYQLFNQNSIATYWDESSNYYKMAGVPDSDLPGYNLLNANDTTLQYVDLNTGVVKINPKKHRNMLGSASGTTITMTLVDVTERVQVGHKVLIEDSNGFTPSINGTYTVATVPTDNTFTFTVGASTTSSAGASASVSFLNTSKLYVNTIELNDPSFGSLAIPGLPLTEDINLANNNTTPVSLTVATTRTYGAYLILVQDISTAGNLGAMATFSVSRTNGGSVGDVSRFTNARGDENQRILMDWPSGGRPRLYHSPAGSTVRTNTYRVRVFSLY